MVLSLLKLSTTNFAGRCDWVGIWGVYCHCGWYDVGVVFGFGALLFRRSMPTFRRNMLFLSSGLKWQPCEIEGLFRIWGRKAEGKLSLRDKECGRNYAGEMFSASRTSGTFLFCIIVFTCITTWLFSSFHWPRCSFLASSNDAIPTEWRRMRKYLF
jgi:hypothetical protein